MPTNLEDVDTSGVELFFATDIEGETFTLRDPQVYEAEEVRAEEEMENPQFGRWFPVEERSEAGDDLGATGWIVAVGELTEELQQMDADPTAVPWTVTRCQKSGDEQTDPYEVNVTVHDGTDDQQDSL